MVDMLANGLSSLKMAEMRGKPTARLCASNLVKQVLLLLQSQGYIKEFELMEDGKSGVFVVSLNGSVNNCGVIRPRSPVKASEWEKSEERYLPARGVGLLIVTTPAGVLTHVQAKEKHTGGRLLAFVY
jgi:small subunit ribosomal protein S8